jgi:hypothetical protein
LHEYPPLRQISVIAKRLREMAVKFNDAL